MVGSEVYNPEQWTNFFVLVGTGSAALTGLVFVAMSINLKGVAKDATHRYRAINMLSGFTAVFLVGALALMGHQTHRALGVEWLIVSLLAASINTNGYIQGWRSGGRYALSYGRIIGGSACYLGQIIGVHDIVFRLRIRGIYRSNSSHRQFLLYGVRLLASDRGHITELQ
jgi:hypothetical protein